MKPRALYEPRGIASLVSKSITPPWLEHVTRLREELAVANETIAKLQQELANERERSKGFENAATIAPAAGD